MAVKAVKVKAAPTNKIPLTYGALQVLHCIVLYFRTETITLCIIRQCKIMAEPCSQYKMWGTELSSQHTGDSHNPASMPPLVSFLSTL